MVKVYYTVPDNTKLKLEIISGKSEEVFYITPMYNEIHLPYTFLFKRSGLSFKELLEFIEHDNLFSIKSGISASDDTYIIIFYFTHLKLCDFNIDTQSNNKIYVKSKTMYINPITHDFL